LNHRRRAPTTPDFFNTIGAEPTTTGYELDDGNAPMPLKKSDLK